eukprot:756089-Hanusia_phi.AAC.1
MTSPSAELVFNKLHRQEVSREVRGGTYSSSTMTLTAFKERGREEFRQQQVSRSLGFGGRLQVYPLALVFFFSLFGSLSGMSSSSESYTFLRLPDVPPVSENKQQDMGIITSCTAPRLPDPAITDVSTAVHHQQQYQQPERLFQSFQRLKVLRRLCVPLLPLPLLQTCMQETSCQDATTPTVISRSDDDNSLHASHLLISHSSPSSPLSLSRHLNHNSPSLLSIHSLLPVLSTPPPVSHLPSLLSLLPPPSACSSHSLGMDIVEHGELREAFRDFCSLEKLDPLHGSRKR